MTPATVYRILLLALAALFFLVPPARGQVGPVSVTEELVCRVQHAIRWREAAWDRWQCVRISDAVNAAAAESGQRDDLLLAIAINESDLRPYVERWYGFLRAEPGAVGDFGLMGVRCRLGPDMLCSEGLARGMKYPQLLRPEVNLRVAAKILARKPKLNDYNGGDGYASRVRAIAAALAGVEVKVKSKRVRKLVRQILGGHS